MTHLIGGLDMSNKTLRKFILAVLFLVISPRYSRADGLSADDQAFFDKHSSDVVKLDAKKLDTPAFVKVFSAPFFTVKVIIKQPDGDMSNDIVVARVGEKLVCVSRPGSDADLPDFVKMINPDFKLKSDDDAKTMQTALDAAYPIIGSDDDKKAEAFKHVGNQWIFIRGNFFQDKMGYVFDVDADGKIKSAKYMLKLP
jgi:hypothetical protein